MSPIHYSESTLDPAKETLRERSFTRWLSRDLKQATVDFCKNLGLIPIYAETREDGKGRYLFWHPPQGTAFQVRSGYAKVNHEELLQKSEEAGWPLLSLHISRAKEDLYSAVWVSVGSTDAAIDFLSIYGITPPKKNQKG
jgi:hypothetical protein